MTQKYYLAHPCLSEIYIRKWEKQFERKHKHIELVNPFYEGNYDEKQLSKKIVRTRLPPEVSQKDCNTIVENDLKYIRGSDVVLGIIDGNVSYGTIMEIFYAHSIGKPVYLIITNKYEYHVWLNYVATNIFTSFNEFENFIIR